MNIPPFGQCRDLDAATGIMEKENGRVYMK